MKILRGKKIARKIKDKLKQEVAKMDKPPVLAVVLVGDDSVSKVYIKIKEKVCREIGVGFKSYQLPANSSQTKILQLIEKLNKDEKTTAIIIQLPLPKHLDTKKIINAVSPKKDADCLNEQSESRTPTVAAIMEIFNEYKIDLKNKNICLVGYGRLVGKPLTKELEKIGIAPDICNSKTKNLAQHTKKADILISATGVPHLIRKEMIKKDAVIIDAGTSVEKISNSKRSVISVKQKSVVGDVDFETVKHKTSYITPPVGGVGAVTVAKLMENVIKLIKKEYK